MELQVPYIVFAPKYRRLIIYGKVKKDMGIMLRELCEYKGVETIEAEACKDHIQMLVSIPPKYSVSQIMEYLKGKNSLVTKYYKIPTEAYLTRCELQIDSIQINIGIRTFTFTQDHKRFSIKHTVFYI